MRRFADVPTVEFDDLREDLEWVLRRFDRGRSCACHRRQPDSRGIRHPSDESRRPRIGSDARGSRLRTGGAGSPDTRMCGVKIIRVLGAIAH